MTVVNKIWKILVVVSLSGLVWMSGPALAQSTDDAIVARVNGEAILLSQLKESAFDQEVPLASLTSAGMRGDGYRRAITELIDETLLVQRATSDEIKVNDMEIARQVDEMIGALRNHLGGSQKKLEDFLAQRSLTLTSLRKVMTEREQHRSLETQLIVRRVSVDAGAIEKYANERRANHFHVEEISLGQILIRCPLEEQQTVQGIRLFHQAVKIAREVAADPKKFADEAHHYSDDQPSRAHGGLLGWLDPSSLRPALEEQVRKMKPGDVSPPVATEDGYHILLLASRETTRDLLFAERFAEERGRIIEQLRRDASIHLYDLNGKPLDDPAVVKINGAVGK